MRMQYWIYIFLIFTGLVNLTGCSDKVDSDVEEFVAKAKTQKTGHVTPLPTFPKPPAFKYTAIGLRDPFQPYLTNIANKKPVVHEEAAPDLNRPREPLEAYSLDSLKMVGTLERDNIFYALLKDSNGILHRVSVGNYVGQNSGHIEKITENSMDIKEWVSDGKGGWREHWVTIYITR